MTSHKKPTAAAARRADIQRRAMDLRIAGATFQQIADKLGYANKSSAYRAVVRGMTETQRPPADELRMLESMRLERLLLAVWHEAMAGDLKAVDTARRIVMDRARLLGLVAQPAAEVNVSMVNVLSDHAQAAATARADEASAYLDGIVAGPPPAALDAPQP